jgi:hypothetical protein
VLDELVRGAVTKTYAYGLCLGETLDAAHWGHFEKVAK